LRCCWRAPEAVLRLGWMLMGTFALASEDHSDLEAPRKSSA
jgi:hypothetical protein